MYVMPTEVRRGCWIPPELKLQGNFCRPVDAGNRTHISARVASALITEPSLHHLLHILDHVFVFTSV